MSFFRIRPVTAATVLAVGFLHLALLAGCASTGDAAVDADVSDEQYFFTSPEEAALALADAAGDLDGVRLRLVLGPLAGELSSGDPLRDDIDLQRFAAAYDRFHEIRFETPSFARLYVGERAVEMPLPIVSDGAGWHFDTAAGVEEVRARRIGRNELAVMRFCGDLVAAQRAYREMNPDGWPVPAFADRVESSPGRRDGLFWPQELEPPFAPLGPRVAEAVERGDLSADRVPVRPYLGYRYRLLTRQGAGAPGGAAEWRDGSGRLVGGFAVVAYPAEYGETGVMSFLLGPDGSLWERDFGIGTAPRAEAIDAYDPTGWQPATEAKETGG